MKHDAYLKDTYLQFKIQIIEQCDKTITNETRYKNINIINCNESQYSLIFFKYAMVKFTLKYKNTWRLTYVYVNGIPNLLWDHDILY